MRKNKILSFVDKIVPLKMILPLLVALLWNCACFYGGKLFSSGMEHITMDIPLDSEIPFIPWTVVIYFVSFPFWYLNFIIGVRREEREAWSIVLADMIAKTICFVCFLLFPSVIERPEIVGDSVFHNLVRLLYSIDTPYALFPSIHCLMSWLSVIALRNNKKVPPIIHISAVLFTVAICICTLTLKQHYFVDTVAGILVAELSYQIALRTGLWKPFKGAYENLYGFVRKKIEKK